MSVDRSKFDEFPPLPQFHRPGPSSSSFNYQSQPPYFTQSCVIPNNSVGEDPSIDSSADIADVQMGEWEYLPSAIGGDVSMRDRRNEYLPFAGEDTFPLLSYDEVLLQFLL